MASERMRWRLERLLNQIDDAESQGNWESVSDLAQDALGIDAHNIEAIAYLEAAERRLDTLPTTVPS